MAVFLVIVIGLVVWSLRLLQRSLAARDSALFLASALVAISAAGVVVVYMLMDGCMSYLTTANLPSQEVEQVVSIPAVLYEPELALSGNMVQSASLTN